MIVSNTLEIKSEELSKREWRKLFASLTYLDTDGREVTCWRLDPVGDTVTFPRGVWSELPDHVRYHDRRSCPEMPALDFALTLDSERFQGQERAVQAMLNEEQGIVVRSPGTGKTQIALAFAARARTRTLVLVHTEDILNQWIEYAEKALPGADIGIIRGPRQQVCHVTIATVQTLHRRRFPRPWWRQFGAVIVDEAHHGAASTWEVILNQCTARYRIGLTATKGRADGRGRTVEHVIGPVIYEDNFRAPESIDVEIIPVRTNFRAMYRGAFDWHRLCAKLEVDEDRNQLIARAVDAEVEKGNSCLVLSRRITHLRLISEAMDTFDERGAFLVGEVEDSDGERYKLSSAERKSIVQRFRSGELGVVLATQLADEALDVPILNRIFLTFPGRHDGRLIQQIGRALRETPHKTEVKVYDFVDRKVRPLHRQWNERRHFYRKSKLTIRGVGSAIFPNRRKSLV